MKRKIKIVLNDVPWSVLFKDNEYIESGRKFVGWRDAVRNKTAISNKRPFEWSDRPLNNTTPWKTTSTVLDYYERDVFMSPMYLSVLLSLRESFTSLVESFILPIRRQLHVSARDKDSISICAHLRQGNNEKGDWEAKTWRHVHSLETILNNTYRLMERIVATRKVSKATLFVASDNADVRPWFEANIHETFGTW